MGRLSGIGLAALMLLSGATLAAAPASAAVVDAQPNGFEVEIKTEVAAPPAKVWAALMAPQRWWPFEHTWSHKSENLSLEPRLGGCFCETLPHGGGARHLTVIYLDPGKQMVLEGAMGPMMFSSTLNRLIWKLDGAGEHTTVTWTLFAGGYYPDGYKDLAPIVDRVLGGQLSRMKAYVETGKPAP